MWKVLYFDCGIMKELIVKARNAEDVINVIKDEGIPVIVVYSINRIPDMSKVVK